MKRLGKPKCHRLYHRAQDPCMPQHLLSSIFSTIMLWQTGSLQTEPQHTHKPRTVHTHADSTCKRWWRQGTPGWHLSTLFLEVLGSKEMGKEASLQYLRAWRNHLSALSSPLIPTKCHSAYICKKAITIFSETIFQKKRKYHSIYGSEHQGRICDKRSSEVFNLPG